ncbi:kinesin-like protein KIN-6 isoform X4 [Magnolia sinica]|uniref:kinesin-like protein KIN-6 isoform X4 n=1 Tax=Magnolia sinica TaxID=86752 RepID=UPI00265B088F|nr:kinesin-like protein KIN-6 isoform X4 [Magnolia sinica]
MDFQFKTTPYTVTVRRNPHRKARQTPSTANAPDPSTSSLPFAITDIPPLPAIDLDTPSPSKSSEPAHAPETLRVFLRIRPVIVSPPGEKKKTPAASGNAASRPKGFPEKEKKKKKKTASAKNNVCLSVNDTGSVTITTPSSMIDVKRTKTETYDGFTHVFSPDSLQREVYERVMDPLVTDFIGGTSRLLVAMGPTGSGKTHTVFGSPREPGMVPLALQRIFNDSSGIGASKLPRSYYLSMFEIYSERGKGERIFDLSPDGGDLCLQQATVKGLQEIMVSDVTQAECLIARGMLKRATAMTNANSQSSRSQCIINIRSASKSADNEDEFLADNAVLTIVDLAGAERERRTGNQGARLLESNFINNTSMVFGLCLRSLLEHQKNPKRPPHKHFQNSLLTRYLRDYLEGKKRMTLILTVKPGEDDHLDTSYLLRQASPYVKIKFNNVEELPNMPCSKRHIPITKIEQRKRRKCNALEASVIDGVKGARDGHLIPEKEAISEKLQELEPLQVLVSSPPSVKAEVHKCGPLSGEYFDESRRKERNDRVMRDFAKALWNVLKEYKKKLEVSENEVQSLKESLTKEKIRALELEEELKDLKSSCSFDIRLSSEAPSGRKLDAASAICATGSLHSAGEWPTNDHGFLEENLTPKVNDTSLFAADTACLNLKGSESNNNVEIDCGSSGENPRIPLMMETSDTAVIDSSFSTKKEFKRQSYQKVDSFPGIVRNAGDLIGPEHSEVDYVSSITEVTETGFCTSGPLASSSQSLVLVEESSCGLTSTMEQNTLISGDENVRAAYLFGVDACYPNPKASECHINVKVPDTSVGQNWKFSLQMESYDAVVLDSRLSIEDFRTQSNENLDSFTANSYDAENSEGVEYLEANDISSVTDQIGCTLFPLATCSQPHALVGDSSCTLTSSMEQNTLTKEQKNQAADSCISPDEDVACNERNAREVPQSEMEHHSCKPLNAEKPRRRLLPASSILVKEVGGFHMEDENPKRRGEKKPSMEEREKTQGSVSLIRLLRSNLYL